MWKYLCYMFHLFLHVFVHLVLYVFICFKIFTYLLNYLFAYKLLYILFLWAYILFVLFVYVYLFYLKCISFYIMQCIYLLGPSRNSKSNREKNEEFSTFVMCPGVENWESGACPRGPSMVRILLWGRLLPDPLHLLG